MPASCLYTRIPDMVACQASLDMEKVVLQIALQR